MPTSLLPFPARPLAARGTPDPAFDALPRLAGLRTDLLAAAPPRRPRWGEPAVFFFDPARQAELAAARPRTAAPADPLADRVAAEMPALLASAEVRRVARGVGLLAAAAASHLPAAKELAALLAVPDDEVVLLLHPAARAGVRVLVRGVADVGQFHALLGAQEVLEFPPPPEQIVAAYSADVVSPTHGDLVAEGHFQMFRPSALQPDGTLPAGYRGSDDWLWPAHPLASVPRRNGERVVLLGEPAFRPSWEVKRPFPGLAASVKVLAALSPADVADELARIAGRPVPEPRLANAA